MHFCLCVALLMLLVSTSAVLMIASFLPVEKHLLKPTLQLLFQKTHMLALVRVLAYDSFFINSTIKFILYTAPRSGLALKHSIDTGAGVIDYDYRGPIGVILFNHSDNDFPIKRGDRVAQLILEKISMAAIQEVQELSSTERGTGGFGSTGVQQPIKIDESKVPSLSATEIPVDKKNKVGSD